MAWGEGRKDKYQGKLIWQGRLHLHKVNGVFVYAGGAAYAAEEYCRLFVKEPGDITVHVVDCLNDQVSTKWKVSVRSRLMYQANPVEGEESE